ncbi:MAG: hypothetical protein DRN20_04750 [Thermoplasmata archaeon]|nr:MAG: hypothetical protein DRN20_04750 [Thermoplasmata archaeon]
MFGDNENFSDVNPDGNTAPFCSTGLLLVFAKACTEKLKSIWTLFTVKFPPNQKSSTDATRAIHIYLLWGLVPTGNGVKGI